MKAGAIRTSQCRALVLAAATLALLGVPGSTARAQTDYYNTDRGRPVQIEDAYAAERYAFEFKLAPVRAEWLDGEASFEVEPEIAYGLLPRTHLEIGVPVAFEGAVRGEPRRQGVAGLEVSLMHNLNAETSEVPALGLRADVLVPVGPLAPSTTYTTLTGMLTRTFQWMRIHLNGQYTVGEEPRFVASPSSIGGRPIEDPRENAEGLSRWLAGIAIDKALPLRSTLLTAELFARQPLVETVDDMELFAGAGVRLQTSPTLALDFGAGRRLDWRGGPWYVTFGTSYAFGIRSLMPGGSR